MLNPKKLNIDEAEDYFFDYIADFQVKYGLSVDGIKELMKRWLLYNK